MEGAPDSWDRLRQDLRGLDAEASAGLPERIGKYPVVRELSRTPSSLLYLARDPELGRPVAIKILRDDRDNPEFIRRFQREGAIAAALRHPNIVTVHEVGAWRDAPYIVMDYVEGGTLAGRRYSPEEAARTLALVADAMAHAHGQGVVHRDLKPANILVDAQGRPIVTDFGLAKTLRGDSVATVEGSILGTPQYMAPEQVRGDSGKVDARTDVYALGAILYELLAGVPPYSDPNLAALFERILRGEAPPPTSRDRTIPRGLQAVALKALRRDPAERYGSAADFARELRSFASGQGVRALGPASVPRRIWVFVAAAAATLLLVAWMLRSGSQRSGLHEERLQNALKLEREGALSGAREAYKLLLDQFPGDGAALAGMERIDWLRQEVSSANAPPPESAWKEIGGSATGGGISRTPAESFQLDLALDGESRPVVAWRDLTGGHDDIYLRRWDGDAWIELAGSATAMGLSGAPFHSRFPSVALDRAGHPWVAWDDQRSETFNILLRRWDGSRWQEVGGSATPRGLSRADQHATIPTLCLDADGNPNVSWLQYFKEDLFEVYFRKWDGSAWIELGGSATGGGVSRNGRKCANPTMALDPAGRPVIAWMAIVDGRYQAACAAWNGKDWEGFGKVVVGGHNRGLGWLDDRCAVAVDRAGRPVLAWQDHFNGIPAIHLRKWDGSLWTEFGGSATDEGVSRGTGWSAAVSLALDPKGNPIVAWWGGSTGNGEIYVRHWDGTAWRDLGGSGSPGGVSRTPGLSGGPVVRVDRGGNPAVSWIELTTAKCNDIYLKRFEEFAPTELRQSRIDPSDAGSISVQAVVRSAVPGSKVRLEVEVGAAGIPFTGAPAATSVAAASGSRVGVIVTGLAAGSNRWRARTVNDLGQASPWVEF